MSRPHLFPWLPYVVLAWGLCLAAPLRADTPAPTPPLAAHEVAVWFAPQAGGAPIFAHRADVPMNPASTMKLLTTLVALDTLGPDYRWRTQLLAEARPTGDTLTTPLYWRGSGDPRFDRDGLADLLRTLRARGVQHLAGGVVLDKQVFSSHGSAANFDHDQNEAFAVPPDGLLSHLKVVWLTLFARGTAVAVALDPPLAGLTVDNQLKLTEGVCLGVKQHVSLTVQGTRLTLSGKLPATCDGERLYASVFDHDQYQQALFRSVWQEVGGMLTGDITVGRTPANSVTLASHDSPTLGEVVREVNKFSNNTMARQLLLTLGVQQPRTGDTLTDGKAVVRQWLTSHGLTLPELVLENGAGLSRRERISAAGLGQVLQQGAASPYAPEFLASLPIAARDGTLRRRFVGQSIAARLKTGSLNGVRTLAGYVKAADGQSYVLVILASRPEGSPLNPALDALVAALIAQPRQQPAGL